MFGESEVELGLVDIGVTGVLGSLWFSDAGSRLGIPSSVSESSLFREGFVDADDKVAFDEISDDSIPALIDVVAGDPLHMDSHRSKYSQTTRPWPLLLPLSTDCLYLPFIFFNFVATICFLISLTLCGKSFPLEFLSESGYCSLKRSSISPYLL